MSLSAFVISVVASFRQPSRQIAFTSFGSSWSWKLQKVPISGVAGAYYPSCKSISLCREYES